VLAEPERRYTCYRLVPEVLDAEAGELSDLAARARAHGDRRQEC
jgi:ArsR family transcriptional regulator, arsenate/arsenite/antimonite-responsive transcriptional repressor